MTWNTYTLILGYDHFQVFLEANDDDDDKNDELITGFSPCELVL